MLGCKLSDTMLSVASTVEPAHKSQLAVTVPAWACYRRLRGSLARSLASGGAWANDAWPVSSVHSPLVVCVVVGCAACPLPPVLFAVPVQPHFQIVCTLRSMCMCVSVLEGAGSGRGGAGNEGGRVESESARARMPAPCPRTTAGNRRYRMRTHRANKEQRAQPARAGRSDALLWSSPARPVHQAHLRAVRVAASEYACVCPCLSSTTPA